MSDISKFVNLLVEFGQKIDGHLNKKYRPFIKQLLIQNVQERAKSMNPQKVALSQQMIAFKLGIQSKSTKCIELTLNYLNKLFNLGFINLNAPNYCEDFVITQSNIQRKKNQKYDKQMKNQILKWLQPLVHFKNNQINNLVLKNYQFLIGEAILPSLIQISQQTSNQLCYSLMCSYFTYRFYLFQEVYLYTKEQISQFKHVPANQRLTEQISNAIDRQQNFQNLIEKYLNEVVAKVTKQGGKYGFCVVCDQPAQYFCKVTKASLCGIQCKKAHLQTAQKQYQNFYQSVYLNDSINEGMNIISTYLASKQSPFLFSVMASLMQKPYLFQLVKIDFKSNMHNHLPKILYKAYQSKNEQIIETLYFMIASLAKWWPTQCLPEIQFFIKQHIVKVLKDKRPNFRLLILVFKSLDKIFQNGRSIVELYINLDCQVNQSDVISNTLFELSKIAQDKFANSNNFNKQQKITIKNSCMTLFMTFSRSLNDYKRNYPNIISVKQIETQKTRKSSLQKFTQKFNQHWSQGLKTLFNLDLVGLDSNQQIVNIIMSLAGLKKKMIDLMMFEKACQQYLQIFMLRLKQEDEPLVFKLLSFYKYIPMTETNSIAILKFVQEFKNRFGPELLDDAKKITNLLIKSQTQQDFRQKIKKFLPQQADYRYLYLRMLTARKPETIGKKKHLYTLCLSQSYLEPLSSQITLLQIPLSYMLQTLYDADKVINLIKQLTPICVHSNWLSLLVKHSGIDISTQQILTPYNIKLIKGILEIAMVKADFIMDWLTILNFICNVYYLLTQNHPSSKKYLAENKSILSQQLTSLMVQNCLINTSIKSESNFSRFMGAVLTIAKEHLAQDQIMMLQKFFHMLDANVQKYLTNFEPIYEQFRRFIQQLKPKTSSQTYIYITDMLKQLLLKVLKSSTDIKDEITVSHLQIFKLILNKNKDNKEIGDFVMNSLSTIVVYNYNLKPKAWKQSILIVDQEAINFPYQTGVIIRKILNQHMKNVQDSGQLILKICLKLIKPDDYKSSIQAIHNIKLCLDLQRQFIQKQFESAYKMMQQDKNKQKQVQQISYKNQITNLKKIVIFSIDSLVQLLSQSFSDTVAETLFSLFSIKLTFNDDLNLTQAQLSSFIDKIFDKLEIMQKVNLQAAEGIMNRTLFWSDNNGYRKIIKNLQRVILRKYTNLSIVAMKCIKTYIQMAKLKEQKQWEDVQATLLKIIQNTQVQRFFTIQKQLKVQQLIAQLLQNKLTSKVQLQNNVDLNIFIHQCQQQMKCVQLLPNHEKCLDILNQVYDEKVRFNDMVIVRTALWKKGLGKEFPPDLLTLQQTISNRIMSIYLREQNSDHILSFTYKILKKYIQSSKILQVLQSNEPQVSANCNNQNYELYNLLIDYWKKRRQPLIKLIGYMMPKLNNECKKKQDRKQLLLYFVKIIPIVENKEAVLKTINQLAEKNMQ